MIRLFAALFPPDGVREHLVTALRPIRDQFGQELRWSDPDNWHITLAFYGDQPNDAADITAHLAQVTPFHRPLTLHVNGAGSFEQRTLWAGLGGQTAELKSLMAECHLPDMEIRNRAHMTFARTGQRSRDPWAVGDIVRALSVYRGPEFTSDEVCLVQSHLGQGRGGGSLYEVVERFPLR